MGTRRLLAAMLLATSPAAADVAEDTEALIRVPFYEGVPYEAAVALGSTACPTLFASLGDPAEVAHHGNALEALGMLRCPGA